MTTKNTTSARVGRERSCVQCGAVYRSPRSNSLYCGNACRMKAKRGTAPTTGHSAMSVIGKLLLYLGYAGPVSHASPVYALTIDDSHALAEMQGIFSRKGWGFLSEDDFWQALSDDGIGRWRSTSPEAADRNRWQARQRAREARQA
ncbi:MAG: hypothetical protein KGL48_16240 [Sphingomonadales bacterium]|nr:hypothetical protein [Sphingomonadales bacterium]MDE2568064.1 hypothetical protein [Sphingomonadales bacterium]